MTDWWDGSERAPIKDDIPCGSGLDARRAAGSYMKLVFGRLIRSRLVRERTYCSWGVFIQLTPLEFLTKHTTRTLTTIWHTTQPFRQQHTRCPRTTTIRWCTKRRHRRRWYRAGHDKGGKRGFLVASITSEHVRSQAPPTYA